MKNILHITWLPIALFTYEPFLFTQGTPKLITRVLDILSMKVARHKSNTKFKTEAELSNFKKNFCEKALTKEFYQGLAVSETPSLFVAQKIRSYCKENSIESLIPEDNYDLAVLTSQCSQVERPQKKLFEEETSKASTLLVEYKIQSLEKFKEYSCHKELKKAVLIGENKELEKTLKDVREGSNTDYSEDQVLLSIFKNLNEKNKNLQVHREIYEDLEKKLKLETGSSIDSLFDNFKKDILPREIRKSQDIIEERKRLSDKDFLEKTVEYERMENERIQDENEAREWAKNYLKNPSLSSAKTTIIAATAMIVLAFSLWLYKKYKKQGENEEQLFEERLFSEEEIK